MLLNFFDANKILRLRDRFPNKLLKLRVCFFSKGSQESTALVPLLAESPDCEVEESNLAGFLGLLSGDTQAQEFAEEEDLEEEEEEDDVGSCKEKAVRRYRLLLKKDAELHGFVGDE